LTATLAGPDTGFRRVRPRAFGVLPDCAFARSRQNARNNPNLIGSVSLWTMLWLFLGVGTACKLGADAD